MNNFFDFKLFSFGDYELRVYHLVIVLIVFVFTKVLIGTIKKILRKREAKNKLDRGHAHTIGKLIQYFLWTVAILFLLQALGVNLTFIIAGSAALLVGLGLGINQIFSDFISGLIILFEGVIKVGDVVEISGRVAQVERINLRTTMVKGRDNIAVIIPNSKFVDSEVINWSQIKDKTRFDFKVGVSYNSDISLVRKLIFDAAIENPNVSKESEPQVRLFEYGDSSLIFQLLFWGENEFRMEGVKSQIRYAIFEKFKEHGVEIPFPQRVLHIQKDSDLQDDNNIKSK